MRDLQYVVEWAVTQIEFMFYMYYQTLYFFGLGNLELKMVAMSEMSLCFGSTQPKPAMDVRRTDRASQHM